MSDAHDIGLRYYFAKVHLDTARLFACECRTIERSHDRADSQQVLTRYQSFAIGAIFAAVAGLEAGINELFVDAVEWHEEARRKQPAPNLGGVLRGLETRVVSKLAKAWKMQKKRPDGKVRHSSTPRVVNKCRLFGLPLVKRFRALSRKTFGSSSDSGIRSYIRSQRQNGWRLEQLQEGANAFSRSWRGDSTAVWEQRLRT